MKYRLAKVKDRHFPRNNYTDFQEIQRPDPAVSNDSPKTWRKRRRPIGRMKLQSQHALAQEFRKCTNGEIFVPATQSVIKGLNVETAGLDQEIEGGDEDVLCLDDEVKLNQPLQAEEQVTEEGENDSGIDQSTSFDSATPSKTTSSDDQSRQKSIETAHLSPKAEEKQEAAELDDFFGGDDEEQECARQEESVKPPCERIETDSDDSDFEADVLERVDTKETPNADTKSSNKCSQMSDVKESESVKKPDVKESESLKKPDVKESESIKKPIVKESESLKKPDVKETESVKKTDNKETESVKNSDVKETESVNTPDVKESQSAKHPSPDTKESKSVKKSDSATKEKSATKKIVETKTTTDNKPEKNGTDSHATMSKTRVEHTVSIPHPGPDSSTEDEISTERIITNDITADSAPPKPSPKLKTKVPEKLATDAKKALTEKVSENKTDSVNATHKDLEKPSIDTKSNQEVKTDKVSAVKSPSENITPTKDSATKNQINKTDEKVEEKNTTGGGKDSNENETDLVIKLDKSATVTEKVSSEKVTPAKTSDEKSVAEKAKSKDSGMLNEKLETDSVKSIIKSSSGAETGTGSEKSVSFSKKSKS
ncbi:hypothetical protein ACHWQZ_G010185 [Mnemiopsis leidyi]